MTESQAPPTGEEHPEPVVRRGRAVSIVWLIPVVAAIVGGYVGYDAYENRGEKITIEFPTAEWIDAGKTKIRYRSVEIGSVDKVVLDPEDNAVEVHCTVVKDARAQLVKGTDFWVVHPRVGAAGISGLGTILSGAYITLRPGPADGPPERDFTGLDAPPLEPPDAPGLRVDLHADKLYSLGIGSPVYFRQIQVGSVERHELDKDGTGVRIQLYFPKEHADLLREDSRFWNAGGIQVLGGLGHLDVQVESLDSILSGGIAFDSPAGEGSPPAKAGAHFWLHPSSADLDTYPMRYGGLRVFVEGARLGSLAVDDPVFYRELPVGAVISKQLDKDSRRVRIGLNIEPRYETLVRSNSVFWNASGISAHLGWHGLEVHTESVGSILRGGVAFATPDPPGDRVKAGSVFLLHEDVKDEWLAWKPLLWRGPPGEAPVEAAKKSSGESRLARFFHYGGKDEKAAKQDEEPSKDATQASAVEAKRHDFFHRLFHGGH